MFHLAQEPVGKEMSSWFYKLIDVITNETLRDMTEKKIINSFKSSEQCEIKTMKYIFTRKTSLKKTFSNVLRERKSKIECCHDDAKHLREKGNLILGRTKNFILCSEFYTNAIFAACGNLEETALAHANRAYVLMQLGKFKEAYDDCECCLTGNYPQAKISKIILRQADCATHLRDTEKINRCLDKFQNRNVSDLTPAELTVILKLKEKLDNAKDATKPVLPKNFKEKKQTICVVPQKGRHMIAGEPIKKNEIIMNEEAFAFVPLFHENKSSFDIQYICQGCGETDIVPFPCYDCRNVSYCSIKCRQDHAIIHKFECKGHSKSIFSAIGASYLALRMLLEGFPEMLQHLSKLPQSPEQIWDEILAFSDKSHNKYGEIIRLSTNFNKMNVDDYLHYAAAASFLTVYLQEYSTFFGNIKSEISYHNYTNWELVVSSLLLRHIAQVVNNAHLVTGYSNTLGPIRKNEDIPEKGFLHKLEHKLIFSAIYPRVSLYNHSCEPSFSNRFNKTVLTIIAEKDIREGDEIFNCYGVHFKQAAKEERRYILKKQYQFRCDCKHCKGDDEAFIKYHTYRCTNADCQRWFYLGNSTIVSIMKMFEEKVDYKCPHCKHEVYSQWLDLFMGLVFDKKHFADAYNTYKTAHLYLKGPHDIKEDMCWVMLREWTSFYSTSTVNLYLLHVTNDLLLLIEERYGIHSHEFVEVSARYLDLLALRASIPAATNAKPIPKYDLGKIQSSFEILPDNVQKKFKNYFNKYISN